MSIANSSDYAIPGTHLKASAAVLELGCPNFPAIFALEAAIDFLQAVGKSAIEQRVRELTDYLHGTPHRIGPYYRLHSRKGEKIRNYCG